MVTLADRIGAAKVQNEHSPKCQMRGKITLSDGWFEWFEMNCKNSSLTFSDVTDVNNPSERHLLKKNCNNKVQFVNINVKLS